MEISIIIPAYNEEKRLKNTINAILSYMNTQNVSYEIIIVDDGSCDATAKIAASFPLPLCKTLSNPKNCGKGFSVARGVKAARGNYIFFTDADLSYSPKYLTRAYDILKSGADIAAGQRGALRSGYGFFRKTASRLYEGICKKIIPLEMGDTQCGFKGFRRDCARTLFSHLKTSDFGFDTEILCRAKLSGYKIAPLSVDFTHKKGSHINAARSARMLFDIFRIRRELFGRSFGK